MKRSTKVQMSLAISLFIGVTFAYFMWLTWEKLTQWIGNSTYVWLTCGAILVFAAIFGKFGIGKVAKKFL